MAEPHVMSSETRPAGEATTQSIFASDRPSAAEAAGLADLLAPVAALLAHPRAEAPFTVGLFGGAGGGKSSAMQALLDRAQTLGGSFRLVRARIDATSVGADPTAAIAARIYDALCAVGPDGTSFAALAQDSAHAGRDPLAVAQEASERLGDTKRKLDTERLSLNELDGRRARLVETVLYDSAGSRIESFARANRARIETRLKSFGFFSNDPVATYKDLVRDVYESGGVMGRVGVFFHSLWAFRGQTKLIVWAILLFLASWGLEHLFVTREAWVGWLQATGGEKLAPSIDLLNGNIGLLTGASRIAFWGGVLALVVVVLRALRFTLPVQRGVSPLRGDIETRRRELDGLIALQTRRVDALSAESEAQARRAEEAERRVGAGTSATPVVAEHPFEEAGASKATRAARAFIASVSREIVAASGRAPGRLVLAVDNLDRVPAGRAADVAQAVHALGARAGFVTVLACDASRVWAGNRTEAQRQVQVPLNVDAARLADMTAGSATLDALLTEEEERLLGGLNAVFAATPRAAKRLQNLYRLARCHSDRREALVFLLAVDINGDEGERRRVLEVAAAGQADFDAGSRLVSALDASRASAGDLSAALPVARIYSTDAA